jgi:fatty acid CoA ligase FadD36
MPDEDLGQRIVAYVVSSGSGSGSVDADGLIQYVAQQLSAHKRPREIRFVDSLPRNALGKVLKKQLLAEG